MILNYFTANTTSELICFIFAIICLKLDDSLIWKSMIIYLFLTCFAEFFGKYVGVVYHNNNWVYNVFLPSEAAFTSLMFINLYKPYVNGKPLVINGVILFLVCYVTEIGANGFFKYDHLTYSFMSVQFVLYSLYYFYLLLKDNEIINLKFSAEFWWVAGTLFFYFGLTACNQFDKQLDNIKIYGNEQLIDLIFKVLNVILYGCWTYSFICRKWLTPTLKVR